ncbi:MAG: AarF/UbiB family protein [Elusimicrobia bacterium]|jgi:ubiquinone biosynthesis protein|nr:AarF/UbiB family protein [Elusimicrobiota bacterium]
MDIQLLRHFGSGQIKRLKNIATVLARYGFRELFSHIPVPGKFILPKAAKDIADKPRPVRLRMALEELGAAFIKMGQFASVRPDMLPGEYIAELSKLQDDVPPAPFEKIDKYFKKVWGKNWRNNFITFIETPVAGASISQVYKGRLTNGDVVAVKVRRPGVKKEITADVGILKFLAEFLQKQFEITESFQPVRLVESFSANLRREIDLKREAVIINKFRENHRDFKDIVIPKVYRELTAEGILVMEFINGRPVDKADIKTKDRRRLAKLGIRVMTQQILVDGLFHADPHPGNILYTEDGKLSYLDFGLIGRLSTTMKNHLTDIFMAVSSGESEWILQEVLTIAGSKDEIDRNALLIEIMEIKDKYMGISLKDISIGKAFMELFNIIRTHNILIQPAYSFVGKAVLTSENTARLLDEDIDIMEVMEPQLKKIAIKRYSPKNLWISFRMLLKDSSRFLKDFPTQIREVLNKLKAGQLEIEFRHVGLENLIHTLDKLSNRIAFSLIIAALIIGSSLIIQLQSGPMFFGISAFGLSGYLFASILGVWLLWSIIRSGRL